MSPIIKLSRVCKDYRTSAQTVRALREVDLEIPSGQFVAIMGASGSGKSTLLNLLGGLDTPTRGECWIDGRDTAALDADALAGLRNRSIGFIFQNFNLLASATAVENVELPALYRGWWAGRRRRRAREVLEQLGLGDRIDHLPSQLSGGQQQRVAVARALITDPPILLADEPTGNLDSHTGQEILEVISRLHAQRAFTIVMVTHDREIATYAERVVVIQDGRIGYDAPTPRAGGQAMPDVRALPGATSLSSAEPVGEAV